MKWDAFVSTYAECFPNSRPWKTHEFADLENQRHVEIYGDADAFLVLQIIEGEAEILTLATHPKLRRQGRASGLLRAAINNLETKSVSTIFLEVAADNTPAIQLYQRFGFEKAGMRKRYYKRKDGSFADAVVMVKALSA